MTRFESKAISISPVIFPSMQSSLIPIHRVAGQDARGGDRAIIRCMGGDNKDIIRASCLAAADVSKTL